MLLLPLLHVLAGNLLGMCSYWLAALAFLTCCLQPRGERKRARTTTNSEQPAHWAKETTLPGPNQPTSYPNRRGDAGLLENTAGVTPAREYLYIYIYTGVTTGRPPGLPAIYHEAVH